MHELTIATSLVEIACAQAERVGAARVAEINIRMGQLTGIARSLYFCFGSATRGTLCEGATLHIEEVPLKVMCNHCDEVKTPTALYSFRCPDCGMPTPQVVSGREMEVISLGLVPPDDATAGAACGRPAAARTTRRRATAGRPYKRPAATERNA